MNCRVPEMAIYYKRICASFHLSALYARVPHSPTGPPRTKAVLATIKLVWTVLILNSSEATESLTNSEILKMYS